MNNKNYKYEYGEEVKIINGVFKGIYGIPEQIEMSSMINSTENTLVHIKVDNYNVIKVNINDVEFLYDDYLIYKINHMKIPKVQEIIGKFRIKKDRVNEFLALNYNSMDLDFSYISLCAITLDKVEIKFEDKTLTIEEIKKIVN